MNESDIRNVVLNRGTQGLGFNIRGGKDQPHLVNDDGIFVTKIRGNGAAAIDGTLQEGDKILEINGNSMEDLEHQQAVDLFLNAGDEVKLKIWSGAENRLLEIQTEDEEKTGSTNKKMVISIVVVTIGCFVLFYHRKDLHKFFTKLTERKLDQL